MNRIKIIFPDQTVKEYEKGVTPFQIAEAISLRLAQDVLAANVNDQPWDLNRGIETDASIKLFKWDDAEGMKDFIDTCWEKFRNDDRTSDTADISGYSRRELTAKMARLMESLLE